MGVTRGSRLTGSCPASIAFGELLCASIALGHEFCKTHHGVAIKHNALRTGPEAELSDARCLRSRKISQDQELSPPAYQTRTGSQHAHLIAIHITNFDEPPPEAAASPKRQRQPEAAAKTAQREPEAAAKTAQREGHLNSCSKPPTVAVETRPKLTPPLAFIALPAL